MGSSAEVTSGVLSTTGSEFTDITGDSGSSTAVGETGSVGVSVVPSPDESPGLGDGVSFLTQL